MAKTPLSTIEIRETIALATIQETNEGSVIKLDAQVTPSQYKEFKQIVEHCGGIYKGKNIGHVFSTGRDGTLRSIMAYVERMANGQKLNTEEFFPTPPAVSEELLNIVLAKDSYLQYRMEEHDTFRLLEPSAGDGSLIDEFLTRVPDYKGEIVLMEIDPLRIETLNNKYGEDPRFTIIEGDFSDMDKDTLGEFDTVLMNPPFKVWKEHYSHAKSLLKNNDSVIAAVLPEISHHISKDPYVQNLVAKTNTQAAIMEHVDAGAFNNHKAPGRKGRAATQKTGISTILVVENNYEPDFMKVADLVLETSIQAWNKIAYSEMKRLASQDDVSVQDVDKSIEKLCRYLIDNKSRLITDDMIALNDDSIATYLAFQELGRVSNDSDGKLDKVISDAYQKHLKPVTYEGVVNIKAIDAQTPEDNLRHANDVIKGWEFPVSAEWRKNEDDSYILMTATINAYNMEDARHILHENMDVMTLSYIKDGKTIATWTPEKEAEPTILAPEPKQASLDF